MLLLFRMFFAVASLCKNQYDEHQDRQEEARPPLSTLCPPHRSHPKAAPSDVFFSTFFSFSAETHLFSARYCACTPLGLAFCFSPHLCRFAVFSVQTNVSLLTYREATQNEVGEYEGTVTSELYALTQQDPGQSRGSTTCGGGAEQLWPQLLQNITVAFHTMA